MSPSRIQPSRSVRVALTTAVALVALATFGGVAKAGDDGRERPDDRDAPTRVTLTGYFTDEWCGKSNANPEGAECARRCAAKGSAMMLYADGKLYRVRDDDKQQAVDNVGVEVVVDGTLDEDGRLAIAKIAPKDKASASARKG